MLLTEVAAVQPGAFSKLIASRLDHADLKTKRDIIRALVKRIDIGKKDVRIVYRISPRPFVVGPANGANLQHCQRHQDVFHRTLTKNWLFAGSDEGGKTAAVLYSIVATCKQLSIEPFTYLRDVLTRLPQTPAEQHANLLPAAWAKSRPEPTPPQP